MTKEDLKALAKAVARSNLPRYWKVAVPRLLAQEDAREAERDTIRDVLNADLKMAAQRVATLELENLRLKAQEEARGETPEGDGLDYKASIDKRPKFSQLDLDTVTKPLHAEIERLKVGWQQIETAPKDGTSVLLFDGEQISYGGWTTLISAGWWSVDALENQPTFWMPLPPAPTGQD